MTICLRLYLLCTRVKTASLCLWGFASVHQGLPPRKMVPKRGAKERKRRAPHDMGWWCSRSIKPSSWWVPRCSDLDIELTYIASMRSYPSLHSAMPDQEYEFRAQQGRDPSACVQSQLPCIRSPRWSSHRGSRPRLCCCW